MPSWTRSRSERPKEKASEKSLHHRTNLEQTGQQNEQEDIQPSLMRIPTRRNRRLRDSVVSLSAVNEALRPETALSTHLQVPESPERPVKSNRFSLLRSRHASDSQLSKTAREHAENTPPIPKGM